MSKEIYLYSEDKKYKCAVELADSCDRFGYPDRSVIILTEERPDGTYIIAKARDRILETEKDKQIADLQHRLEVAEIATKLACKEIDSEYMYGVYRSEYPQYFKEQAEKELKGEEDV